MKCSSFIEKQRSAKFEKNPKWETRDRKNNKKKKYGRSVIYRLAGWTRSAGLIVCWVGTKMHHRMKMDYKIDTYDVKIHPRIQPETFQSQVVANIHA